MLYFFNKLKHCHSCVTECAFVYPTERNVERFYYLHIQLCSWLTLNGELEALVILLALLIQIERAMQLLAALRMTKMTGHQNDEKDPIDAALSVKSRSSAHVFILKIVSRTKN